MNNIRIGIVDDENLIRDGLKMVLSTFDDISIIGEASDGYEAFNLCHKHNIDLLLMDIRMPNCNGVTATKLVKDNFPNTKVLILTTFNDDEYIQEALLYGASGYLLKDSSTTLIYDSIKASYTGTIVVHPKVASKILTRDYTKNNETLRSNAISQYDLTPREISIIEGISDGKSNKEIAETLFLTEGTIKNNITSILLKLNLRDRTQIAIFAFKNQFIS